MHTQFIQSPKLNPHVVAVDMRTVAATLMGVASDKVDLSSEPFYISKDTQLWRFDLAHDADVHQDKMHLLVDGCGVAMAIVDPDTPQAVQKSVHLSDFL
jgi:hypothetical protein